MNKIIKEKINELKGRVAKRGAFIPYFEVLEIIDELAQAVETAEIEETGSEFVYDANARDWMLSLKERGLEILLPDVFLGASVNYSVAFNGESVGNGVISNEGLSHEETAYKIAKLCNAENLIAIMAEGEETRS